MTNTAKQPSCEQRVDRELKSTINTIRYMFRPDRSDVELVDDGSLDTVLRLDDEEFRYSDTSSYRDEETGELDLDALLDDEWDGIADRMREAWYEFGLSFDYVAPDTFPDQEQGYFCYQLSWGGPSDEFRFYVNPDLSCYRVEYWFLDWFDGAFRELRDADKAFLLDIWAEFEETGTAEAKLDEAK